MRSWICFSEVVLQMILLLLSHHFSITLREVAALSLTLSRSSHNSSHSIGECDALLQFSNSFTISPDASWICGYPLYNMSCPKTASWKSGTDCCSWDGVTCHAATNQVVGLDLSCSQLHGALPSNSTLFFLPNLRRLNLAGNNFSGSRISPRFGIFTRMTHLNLSSSNFSGPAPLEMISLHLSKLISLDLSSHFHAGNNLTVEEHDFRLFVHNLTQLRELVLGGTDMSKVSPISLMNLSSTLTSLILFDCGLRGMFPMDVFHLPNVRSLSLSYNYNLTGTLPQTNWTSQLVSLDLSYTGFQGSILTSLGNHTTLQIDRNYSFPKLRVLGLSGCHLTRFPYFLTSSKKLESLDLSENMIRGQIPEWLGGVWRDRVTTLKLSSNNFTGEIPSSICQLSSLANLILSNNRLNGTIPGCLGNLSSLAVLDLHKNQLQGPLPWSISNCTRLLYLNVGFNGLYDTFPHWLNATSSLKVLDLESNKFHGVIQTPLPQLSYLIVTNNNFSGALPRDFFSLNSKAITIVLVKNNFEGPPPIPPPTVNFYFGIAHNKFSGGIPHQFCNATQLKYLDLSFNRLTGTIPHCFINFNASLLAVDLRANRFFGQIPEIFAPQRCLKMVQLSQNRFTGILPRSLARCEQLEVLDLSNNELEDSFPYWLETHKNLKVLILSSNKLSGPVHSSQRDDNLFPKLQILDISNNSFSGPLPAKYIANLQAMKDEKRSSLHYIGEGSYKDSVMVNIKGMDMEIWNILTMLVVIDFSSNSFGGTIPKVIGDLKSLKGLNLSCNSLSGNIPSSLGNLTNLEWLDLSSNKFGGEIPRELANLTSLSWLNLSNNQLIGQIPQGTQFGTFDHSFDGNPGLCGQPLPKACDDDVQETHPSNASSEEEAESRIGIEWRAVPAGIGCGLVFGISAGYIMLETRRPRWLARMVERR